MTDKLDPKLVAARAALEDYRRKHDELYKSVKPGEVPDHLPLMRDAEQAVNLAGFASVDLVLAASRALKDGWKP